jgi:exopolyphosphatase / guanosine-5'-triphosphate,3'-diphosphate pyrophosphatase
MQTRTTKTPLLAAIDMGSNSFRLELGHISEGKYRRSEYFKETVRMGAGLDADGMLTEEASERGLACLRQFAKRLTGFEREHVRAVATQTLREARNRNAFLLRAQEALGFAVEVISGREEARLIYAGVAQLQPSDTPRLVVDIGGRSTEIILGQGRTVAVAESFAVGCVSLTLRFFEEGRITREAFRLAQVAAGAEFEEALQAFAPERWKQALGSSGTAGAISQVLQTAGITDGSITPQGLRWCMERCLEAGHIERIKLPGLKPERKAVIPGGLAILYTVATHFGIGDLQPAKGALRQGVIVDLNARLLATQSPANASAPADVRDASVAELQKRFAADTAQAARVSSVAQTLFDGLLGSAQTSAPHEARRELTWACALHELGLVVSHHDHHRHSAYLLAHADAPGFSQSQQRRISDLVLAQRGGLRKVESALTNDLFTYQVLALRLAVIKCHARGAVSSSALTLTTHGSQVVLSYGAEWAESHPRTVYLLNEEALAWHKSGVLRLVLAVRGV